MNQLIYSSLKDINIFGNYPKILPHQLASLDYIYKLITKKHKSVLLFHKMGSGKTIISLLLSFYLTKVNKKVFILLPNHNIKTLWISKINIIKQLTPFDTYKLNNIHFHTKKEFIENISDNANNPSKVKKIYENSVFIIDEAHNFFGNTGSKNIEVLQDMFSGKDDIFRRPIFVLVTGSPITNTPLTLKDLINILTYKKITENDYMIQDGNKIYNISISPEGEKLINDSLYQQITYFGQEKEDVPKIKYKGTKLIKLPFIICKMSKEQTQNYNNIKNQVTNDMFLKYLLDVSFTAMGEITNIQNFENIIKQNTRQQLTNTLYINNGRFGGSELETLNNSCKLKYFIENKVHDINNRSKTFIYFSNSRIGGKFLKDVLRTHGVQEYGKTPLDNFTCYYCGKEKKCQKCKPMTYIIITSMYMTNLDKGKEEGKDNSSYNIVNVLLDIYNLSNNDNGEEICFLFGSKIISESYTLRETREIWFLTIPDSLSEMSQIIARCIRTFSYSDLTIPVLIYVLASVQKDFDINKLSLNLNTNQHLTGNTSSRINIEKYINDLMHSEKDYSYDLKKILYLEIKSKQTNRIHFLLKDLSKAVNEKVDEDLEELFVIEITRRLCFSKYKFSLEDVYEKIPEELLSREKIENILNKFVKHKIIVINNKLKKCTLIKKDDFYYCKIIKIFAENFIYQIKL